MPKRKRDADDIIILPSSLVIIPHDVVVEEILEKLPVESLLRFRAVSKLWRREIQSRRFHERHLRHQEKSRDPSILVYQPWLDDYGKASLRTLSLGATSVSLENHTQYPVHTKSEFCGVKITQSCDGLACLYSNTFMYVINPATRWYRKLPEARFQTLIQALVAEDITQIYTYPLLGFGKDNVTGIYKMVWLYSSSNLYVDTKKIFNACEVFSFDTNNAWRNDVIVSTPYLILHDIQPLYAHGSLHWFIDAVTETQVLSFDLHTETFAVMTKIPVADAPNQWITMCTLNNRLCLSEDKGEIQTIWSLNQEKMAWDKTYSINLRSTLSCMEDKYFSSTPPIASLVDNRLLLYGCSDEEAKLVIYNKKLNSFSKPFRSSFLTSGVISYSQSLFTLP